MAFKDFLYDANDHSFYIIDSKKLHCGVVIIIDTFRKCFTNFSIVLISWIAYVNKVQNLIYGQQM